MDHPAGTKATEDSALTPWESIDPNEPAGAAHAAAATENDGESLSVYDLTKLEQGIEAGTDDAAKVCNTPAESTDDVAEHDQGADPLSPALRGEASGMSGRPRAGRGEGRNVEPLRLSEPPGTRPLTLTLSPVYRGEGTEESPRAVERTAFNYTDHLHLAQDDSAQALDTKQTFPRLVLEHPACLDAAPLDSTPHVGSSETGEPNDAAPLDGSDATTELGGMGKQQLARDELEPLCADQEPGQTCLPMPPEQGSPSTSLDSSAESDDSREMFGETIDALDAMPDTMQAIADVTDVVGEALTPVAQHVFVPAEAAARPEGSVVSTPVAAEAPSEFEEPALENPAVESPFEEELTEEQEEEALVAAHSERELAETVFVEDAAEEPELEDDFDQRWEDPELDGELEPVGSGAAWTIPLLCLGIALIACCIVIPQADANRRLAYEKMTLTADLDSIQKQVAVNEEFLKKVVDDPSLAERLAQRQLKQVRKGQRVLRVRDEKPEMSPFQITAVTPPPAAPPYKPLGGTLASLCYNPGSRLYVMGAALVMIAGGLVLGVGGRSSECRVQNAE